MMVTWPKTALLTTLSAREGHVAKNRDVLSQHSKYNTQYVFRGRYVVLRFTYGFTRYTLTYSACTCVALSATVIPSSSTYTGYGTLSTAMYGIDTEQQQVDFTSFIRREPCGPCGVWVTKVRLEVEQTPSLLQSTCRASTLRNVSFPFTATHLTVPSKPPCPALSSWLICSGRLDF